MPWIKFCSKSSTALVYAGNANRLLTNNPDWLSEHSQDKENYQKLFNTFSDRIQALCFINQNQFQESREKKLFNDLNLSVKRLIDLTNYLNSIGDGPKP